MSQALPSHSVLGNLVRNIWNVSANPLHVGQFLVAYTKADHPALSTLGFGEVVAALMATDMDTISLGRFITLELGIDKTMPRLPVPGLNTAGEGVTEQRVIELLEHRLSQLDSLSTKKTARSTITLSINANKLHTSVSVDRQSVEAFTSAVGRTRLRALLREVTAKPLVKGMNRSFLVQQAINELLAQHGQVTYPHGITVIQGG